MHRIWSVTPQGNAIRRRSVWRSASQVWTFAANRIETLNPTNKTKFYSYSSQRLLFQKAWMVSEGDAIFFHVIQSFIKTLIMYGSAQLNRSMKNFQKVDKRPWNGPLVKTFGAEIPWTQICDKEFQMSLSFSKFVPLVIVFVGCN